MEVIEKTEVKKNLTRLRIVFMILFIMIFLGYIYTIINNIMSWGLRGDIKNVLSTIRDLFIGYRISPGKFINVGDRNIHSLFTESPYYFGIPIIMLTIYISTLIYCNKKRIKTIFSMIFIFTIFIFWFINRSVNKAMIRNIDYFHNGEIFNYNLNQEFNK